jgi:ferredoxin
MAYSMNRRLQPRFLVPYCAYDDFNTNQTYTDRYGLGDVSDDDDDDDGISDATDDCPLVSNTDQANHYGTPAGHACEDTDDDGILDATDNCPWSLIQVNKILTATE